MATDSLRWGDRRQQSRDRASQQARRVDLDRGRRRACGPSAAAAARRAPRTARRRGRAAPGPPPGSPRRRPSTGPSTSAPGGAVEQGQRVVDGARLPGDRGQPARRAAGAPPGARAISRAAKPAGSQRTSACSAGWAGSPTATTRPPGRTSAAGVAPAAQRLLVGAQVGAGRAAARCRAARPRRTRPRRPARRPGVATTIAGCRPPSASTRSPLGGAHPGPGKRAAELLGGAGVAQDRRAQAAVAALGAGPARRRRAAPAAGRRRGRPGQRQRAGAGRAPGRRAAALAGQRGGVARRAGSAPAPAPLEAAPRIGVVDLARASGRRGRAGRARGRGRWRRRPRRVTRRAARAGRASSRAQPVRRRYSRLDGAREAADQRGRALALGAQQQRLAGVRVRRARLGVQVVAVVPDHDQARGRGPARSARRGCRPRPAGRRRLTARKSR